MHPWMSDEASRFLAYIDQHRDSFRTLYRLALRTGARKGELLALRVNDFDPKRQSIKITKSYNDTAERYLHVYKERDAEAAAVFEQVAR